MKVIYEKIWNIALPYQDKRDDKGHAEITTNYAKKLLKTEPGDETIVIPAIMLHDIGWSQLSKEERFRIFDDSASKDAKLEVRYKHQDQGVNLAKDILNQISYPVEKIKDILEIISQHDTRKGFISENEGLVRDADKLWRFSKVGFSKDIERSNHTSKSLCEKLAGNIEKPGFFYSAKSKDIAYNELRLRKEE